LGGGPRRVRTGAAVREGLGVSKADGGHDDGGTEATFLLRQGCSPWCGRERWDRRNRRKGYLHVPLSSLNPFTALPLLPASCASSPQSKHSLFLHLPAPLQLLRILPKVLRRSQVVVQLPSKAPPDDIDSSSGAGAEYVISELDEAGGKDGVGDEAS
jgi:hypothetical protein